MSREQQNPTFAPSLSHIFLSHLFHSNSTAMKKYFLSFLTFAVVSATAIMVACTDHAEPIPEPTQFAVSDFVSGLRAPIGMVIDEQGRFWVTEGGTGHDDGALVMISPQGIKTTVITDFKSIINQGNVEGISHLYYDNGTLYLLHGVEGLLYIINPAAVLAEQHTAAQGPSCLREHQGICCDQKPHVR